MRRVGMRWVVVALLLCSACGGQSNEPGAAGEGVSGNGAGSTSGAGSSSGTGNTTDTGGTSGTVSNGTGGGGTGAQSRVPEKHRTTAQACDNERPPSQGQGTGECSRDADCTNGDNGRCSSNRGLSRCTYDVCFEDAECTGGGPCACGGGFGAANACLPGNCQVDADCGSGGYCSPTFGDCGNYSGVIAYYCHTPNDACVDDSECTNAEVPRGYCMYRPERGYWVCGYGQCVG
jgi:hypothetical protein